MYSYDEDLSYCVYIILCADETTYAGYSNRLDDRLVEHQMGEVNYTSSRLPVELNNAVFSRDKYQAIGFEKYLESGSGKVVMNKHFV